MHYLTQKVDQMGDWGGELLKFIHNLYKFYFTVLDSKKEVSVFSYHYWSWGLHAQEEFIGDTSSNTSESINARLIKDAPTTYQKLNSSAT